MNWLRSLMLPVQGSQYAGTIDNLYLFIVAVSVISFIGISILTGWFVWRYRHTRSTGPTPHMTHNTMLEVVWSVIPAIIMFGLFGWGFTSYINAGVAPGDAMEIQVSAKKWIWTFEYPDGMRTVNEIHIPVNRPVKFVMASEDVIHSFFVPTMRVKQDVLPNRYTELWFQPTKTGIHQLFCAEYCGKSHSDMLGKIYVDDDATYRKWVEEGDEATKTMPLPQLGALLFESRGCSSCHSLDGSRGQGPSFKGIFGHNVQLSDGKTVMVDANYIRESILEPQAKVVAGFEPIMPTFKGMLRDRELLALIEFVKSRQ